MAIPYMLHAISYLLYATSYTPLPPTLAGNPALQMLQRLPVYLLLLLPTLGFSQESPPLSTTGEEVIVTGARYARPAAESPEHVTVIDSAQIARATDLSQLLSEQAGIVVNGAYSNPGKDKSLFLRNGANQYTLILIDGQPLIDPSSLGGAVDLRLLSLQGIERIEILRGARSLLYGSDAVAGVINLITTKDPAPDPTTTGAPSPRRRVHLRAAAQRYGTFEGNATVSGTTEKFDYRVGYDYFTTDGLSEAAAPEGSPVEFGKDGASRRTYTAGLTYRPSAEWSIRPSLRRAEFDGDYDAGSFQDADNTYTNELWLPSLAVDFVKEAYSLGGRYNYAATDRIFDDAAFGPSPYRGRAQQGDVYGTYRSSPTLTLTAGTQLRREHLQTGDATADTLSATNVSPYLQLNWRAAERYLVEAGYRYNHHSNFGGQSNYSLAFGVQATDLFRGRISVASAFQSPTLDQLGGPFGANPDLQPQVSTSVEVGTELTDPRGHYRLSLSVFQRNIRDIIIYDATGYQNRDELRDRGVEFEGSGSLNDRLTLAGNVTFVKGRLTETDGTEKEEFFRRPRLSGTIGLTYRPLDPLLVRLSAIYSGERPDVYFDDSFNRFETNLDPYILLNLYGEYQLGKAKQLTVFGEVRNLTNTDFVEVTGFSTLGVTPRVGVAWRL